MSNFVRVSIVKSQSHRNLLANIFRRQGNGFTIGYIERCESNFAIKKHDNTNFRFCEHKQMRTLRDDPRETDCFASFHCIGEKDFTKKTLQRSFKVWSLASLSISGSQRIFPILAGNSLYSENELKWPFRSFRKFLNFSFLISTINEGQVPNIRK